MLNPFERGLFSFVLALVISLGQLWQKGGEILLGADVHYVIQGILKVANDIVLYVAIIASVVIRSANVKIA